jgi:YbgC/YbaW family acyl-CoA thioester hydrolase
VSQIEISVYPLIVQFEELDAGGIVHHPNYLRFCERARCDAIASRGYSFGQCMADGTTFVVAEALIRFLRPALQSEKLFVVTANAGYKKSSIKVFQTIVKTAPTSLFLASAGALFRLPDTLFQAQLRLVHVDISTARPTPMSETLLTAFGLSKANNQTKDPRYGDARLTTDWDSVL